MCSIFLQWDTDILDYMFTLHRNGLILKITNTFFEKNDSFKLSHDKKTLPLPPAEGTRLLDQII